jgi:hypothetical protein
VRALVRVPVSQRQAWGVAQGLVVRRFQDQERALLSQAQKVVQGLVRRQVRGQARSLVLARGLAMPWHQVRALGQVQGWVWVIAAGEGQRLGLPKDQERAQGLAQRMAQAQRMAKQQPRTVLGLARGYHGRWSPRVV